ncbi:hypothetical protein [Neokomagataea tanensis]|nr:hypothetical protein [Neokomagataea tanensis]
MTLYRMMSRFALVALPAAVMSAGVASAASAGGLSGSECHSAFQSAKTSGTLQGQNYLAFKASHCAAGAAPAATSQPAASAPEAPAETKTSAAQPSSSSAASSKPAKQTSSVVQTGGNAVFPNAIAPQFAKLSAGKARLKTCAAQYQANKANGGNAGMTWISKGGGYWSACNAHLKG